MLTAAISQNFKVSTLEKYGLIGKLSISLSLTSHLKTGIGKFE
jgi:hypothetical protein